MGSIQTSWVEVPGGKYKARIVAVFSDSYFLSRLGSVVCAMCG